MSRPRQENVANGLWCFVENLMSNEPAPHTQFKKRSVQATAVVRRNTTQAVSGKPIS